MSEQQTIVYRQYVEPKRRTVRNVVLSGDRVAEVNRQPSCSYNNETYYHTARLVTVRDRRTQWYCRAQWDDSGNSDWLT